jgi:uncharacterized membrane protein
MLFLIILLVGVALAWLLPVPGRRPLRDVARIAMALAFVFAGVAHLLMPTPFVQHLPTWVPARHALIYLTGVIEIIGGLGLIGPRRWQRPVALLVALYLVAVLPANVYVAVADVAVDGQPGGWYPWLRLPLQALFIGWVLWSTPKPRDVQHAVERGPEPAMVPAGR